jgi:hypothetical protein
MKVHPLEPRFVRVPPDRVVRLETIRLGGSCEVPGMTAIDLVWACARANGRAGHWTLFWKVRFAMSRYPALSALPRSGSHPVPRQGWEARIDCVYGDRSQAATWGAFAATMPCIWPSLWPADSAFTQAGVKSGPERTLVDQGVEPAPEESPSSTMIPQGFLWHGLGFGAKLTLGFRFTTMHWKRAA